MSHLLSADGRADEHHLPGGGSRSPRGLHAGGERIHRLHRPGHRGFLGQAEGELMKGDRQQSTVLVDADGIL